MAGPPRLPPRGPRKNRLPAIAVIVVVVLGLDFVLVNALGGATTSYRNVDEAVAQRQELDTKRFRPQGTVEQDTIERTGERVTLMVTFIGVEIPVQHFGDPPEMFMANEAVLLEGHTSSRVVTPTARHDREAQRGLRERERGPPPGRRGITTSTTRSHPRCMVLASPNRCH